MEFASLPDARPHTMRLGADRPSDAVIAEAMGRGGCVVLSPGSWHTNETIEVPAGVTLRGHGKRATRIFTHARTGIALRGDFARVEDLSVEPAAVCDVGIDASRHHVSIRDAYIIGCDRGILVEGYSAFGKIADCFVQSCTTGIRFAFGARSWRVRDCRIQTNAIGVQIEGRTGASADNACNDIRVQDGAIDRNQIGVQTIAESLNDVYGCWSTDHRAEGNSLVFDIGIGTRFFTHGRLMATGNAEYLRDLGTDTAEAA